MPTAEGIYPKLGGDPIYYSELNQLHKSLKLLGAGSTAVCASGTGPSIAGSVLIPASSVSNPGRIDVNYWVSGPLNTGYQIGISGASANMDLWAGSGLNVSTHVGTCYFLTGSPLSGLGVLTDSVYADGGADNIAASTGAWKYAQRAIHNFNASSAFVIFFKVVTPTSNAQFLNYEVFGS